MENGKDKNGKFAIGNKPPADRKTRGVCGRRKAIDVMDVMLSKAGNQKKLLDDFQRIFDLGPASFFKKYAMPVLPPLTKNPKQEEEFAQMTDEERLQGITAILGGVRKRIARQVAEDDSQVESSGFEFSTN